MKKLIRIIAATALILLAIPASIIGHAYTLDESFSTNDSNLDVGAGGNAYAGSQKIKVNTSSIYSIDLYGTTWGTLTNGYVWVEIHDVGATYPGTTILATSTNYTLSSITGTNGWNTFALPTPLTGLTPGSYVSILVKVYSPTSNGGFRWRGNSGGGYPNGAGSHQTGLPWSWGVYGGGECYDFKSYSASTSTLSVYTASFTPTSNSTATASGIVQTLGTQGYYTKRGIRYGTQSNNYTSNITETGNWTATQLYGWFSETLTGLSTNTTYYYTAMAYDTTWQYGSESTYTTATYPTVQLDTILQSESTLSVLVLAHVVNTGQPSTNVTTKGYYIVSTNTTIDNTYYPPIAVYDPTGWGNGYSFSFISQPLKPGGSYNITAYVSTSTLQGLSNTLPITITSTSNTIQPPTVITGPNQPFMILGAPEFHGSIIANQGVITEYGVDYGLSSDNLTHHITKASIASIGEDLKINDYGAQIQPNTNYYWRFYAKNNSNINNGIGYGNTILWANGGGTPSNPTVISLTPTVSNRSVILYGRITTLGVYPITGVGLSFSTQTDGLTNGYAWTQSGSYNLQDFMRQFDSLPNNTTFYAVAGVVANNQWIWSTPIQFQIGAATTPPIGGNGGNNTATVPNVVVPVEDSLKNILQILGLDSVVGKMIASLALALLAFFVFYQHKKGRIIAAGLVIATCILTGWINLTLVIMVACAAGLFLWDKFRKKATASEG